MNLCRTRVTDMQNNIRIKQVMLIRTDLINEDTGEPASVGKMMAQACHGAVAAYEHLVSMCPPVISKHFIDHWNNDGSTKIALAVNSLSELLEIEAKCKVRSFPHALITDSGITQFNGKDTVTVLGIGPFYSESINELTGHLPLY